MNRFVEYLKKYSFKLGLIIVFVALISVFSVNRSIGNVSAAENAANSLTMPVKAGSTGIIAWLENIYGYMFRYDSLKAENEELKMQLAEAQIQLRKAREAENENKHLRSLLELREKHSDFELESAKIIDRPVSNWSVTYTLSKGQESGITLGNCVIDSSYNLIGQVIEIGDGWSTVRSVIDADMRVGALVGDNGNAAMVVGDFALMHRGETKLTYFTKEAKVVEGDVLITSGKGGAFPRGLTIGTVTSVQSEAGGQIDFATVAPKSELLTVSQVFVIKDFKIVE